MSTEQPHLLVIMGVFRFSLNANPLGFPCYRNLDSIASRAAGRAALRVGLVSSYVLAMPGRVPWRSEAIEDRSSTRRICVSVLELLQSQLFTP